MSLYLMSLQYDQRSSKHSNCQAVLLWLFSKLSMRESEGNYKMYIGV